MATDRQKRLSDRKAEGVDLQKRTNDSRQQTLANRFLQRRANQEAMDIRKSRWACTAQTRRCPEARSMLIDTPECCKAHIRGVMADVAKHLDLVGIRWWIDYGTLLGFIRNGGLIPWDKDCDLGMLADDRQKLLDLQKVFLGIGYHATYASPRPTQRFRTGDRMKVSLSNLNRSNVDIFIWERNKPSKGLLDRRNYIGADLYKGREFPIEWALPLRRGTWDGIDVSVPAEPEKLAEHRYGATWMEPMREKHPAEVRK